MSSSRATNEEVFQDELFKHGLRALDYHLDDLFTHVVCIGFLESWPHDIIHLIHQSDPNIDLNN